MNVLIISQYFWPENFRINDLVTELKQNQINVTILTGIPNYPEGKVFSEFKNNKVKFKKYFDFDIVRIPIISRGKSRFKLFLNYLSFVISASVIGPYKLRGKKFDLIFVYEPSPITVALPAILISKLRNIPIVLWVLDLWPDTLKALGVINSKILLKLIRFMVNFIYDNCKIILGQSYSFVEEIRKYCLDKNKVIYFPSWSEEIFLENNVKKAKEINNDKDSFNILFAGNIGESQNFESLVKAATLLNKEKLIKNIRFIIVGNGRMYHWLKQQTIDKKLTHMFHFLGEFPLERMPSFYAHADAFFISLKDDPILSLTLPAKIQTYMSFGRPVIGMINGEAAKTVNLAKCGFISKAGDYHSFVKNVHLIMKKPMLERIELGNNGKTYSKNHFNRKKLIGKLLLIFKKTV
tara:strand:+ start:24296 stop:25519 length:1224 start_codon:yes stop_codon:yes gene_type:complete